MRGLANRFALMSGCGLSALDYLGAKECKAGEDSPLVYMFDGIENAGWGEHNNTLTHLVDLAQGYVSGDFGSNAEWESECINFITQTSIVLRNNTTQFDYLTSEVLFKPADSETRDVLIDMYNRKCMGTSGSSVATGLYQSIPFGEDTAGKMIQAAAVYAAATSSSASSAYLAGVSKSFGGGNFSNPVSSGIRIGGVYSKLYLGRVYALRLYNRALTEAEIKANYAIDKARFGLA